METLQIDTGTVERLLKDKSAGPFVAESGIKDAHDIVKMHTSGAKGFLIGSSIMSRSSICPYLEQVSWPSGNRYLAFGGSAITCL